MAQVVLKWFSLYRRFFKIAIGKPSLKRLFYLISLLVKLRAKPEIGTRAGVEAQKSETKKLLLPIRAQKFAWKSAGVGLLLLLIKTS